MKNLIFFSIIIFLLSCKSESDELVGHWHSIQNKNENYITLDFNDSLQILNKLSVTGLKEESKRNNNEIDLYPIILEPTTNYQFNEDTLIINDEIKFVKVGNHLLVNDYYSNSEVLIKLDSATSKSVPIEGLKNKKLSTILVGPKKEDPSIDSVFIEVNDVFISYNDIKKYSEMEFDRWSKSRYNMVIHHDSSTSESIIDSLVSILVPLDFIDNLFSAKYNYKLDRIEYEKLKNGR